MAHPSCQECNAIYQELVDLIEISRRSKPGLDASPQQLAAWFDQRDVDEDYQMRVRPALSNAVHRLIEHQKSTGHIVPLPVPPSGLINPN